jgi:hypothetical protein
MKRYYGEMSLFLASSDESSDQHGRFLFSGWVAAAEEWSRFFCPAWQEWVLDGPPAIPYLHMTDMRSTKWREQHGVSRLDAEDRVNHAIALVDQMEPLYPVGVLVNAAYLRKRFSQAKVKTLQFITKPRPFDPDYVCFLFFAFIVLNYVNVHHPQAERVNFLVERNGPITRHMQDFHCTIAQALEGLGSGTLAQLVGEMIPGGKNDIPLQAADVLCWHTIRARRPETMDLADRRRYGLIARRKGTFQELSNEQIEQLAQALNL